MKPFSYVVIRYVQDVQSAEFANVGILLYSREAGFLQARFLEKYGRLSSFYGRQMDGPHFLSTLRWLGVGVRELADAAFRPLNGLEIRGALHALRLVLPPDDSALQSSEEKGGLTADPASTLDNLFDRHVLRYSERQPSKPSRSDDEVLPKLRDSFRQASVLDALAPKIIESPDYSHEFPLSWMNGRLHTLDAVSLDLTEGTNIVEKATKWLGRAHTLRRGNADFNLVLYLGRPRDPDLTEAFLRARHILDTIPGPHRLVDEEDAGRFALEVADQLAHHAET